MLNVLSSFNFQRVYFLYRRSHAVSCSRGRRRSCTPITMGALLELITFTPINVGAVARTAYLRRLRTPHARSPCTHIPETPPPPASTPPRVASTMFVFPQPMHTTRSFTRAFLPYPTQAASDIERERRGRESANRAKEKLLEDNAQLRAEMTRAEERAASLEDRLTTTRR